MPIISPAANILLSIAGGTSVNGLLIPGLETAGGGAFVSETEIIYQVCEGDACQIKIYDRVTQQSRVVDTHGANVIRAGGGVWALWSDDERGYRDSYNNLKFPDACPLAVDDKTGAIALIEQRHGGGNIWWYDGQTASKLIDGWVTNAIFHNGCLSLQLGNIWRHYTDPHTFTTSPNYLNEQVADIRDGLVLSWTPYTFILRELASPSALIINRDGQDFNGQVIRLNPSSVLIASSTTAGERPQDLRQYIVDIANATVNGTPVPRVDITGNDAWKYAEFYVQNVAPTPRGGAFRPMGVYLFGADAAAPGNLTSGADHQTSRPMIEGLGLYEDGSPWIAPADQSRMIAVYYSPRDTSLIGWTADRIRLLARHFQLPNVDKLLDAFHRDDPSFLYTTTVAFARQRQIPVLLYDDHRPYGLHAMMTQMQREGVGVIPAINVYPAERNNIWQINTWHRDEIRNFKTQPVVLVIAGYTQTGNWHPNDVADMWIRIDNLAEEEPNVIGKLIYGYQRRLELPALQTWALDRVRMLTSLTGDAPVRAFLDVAKRAVPLSITISGWGLRPGVATEPPSVYGTAIVTDPTAHVEWFIDGEHVADGLELLVRYTTPGTHNLWAQALLADGQTARTGAKREFTIDAPVATPTPEPAPPVVEPTTTETTPTDPPIIDVPRPHYPWWVRLRRWFRRTFR